MTTSEAIEICEGWFRHLDRQRNKARQMAELATLARTGPEGQKEAKQRMRQIDRQPKVYDGARLEPAVRHLLRMVRPDW